MGVGGVGAAYTVGGSVFPTEKGMQPLIPILRHPNNTSVTPGTPREAGHAGTLQQSGALPTHHSTEVS